MSGVGIAGVVEAHGFKVADVRIGSRWVGCTCGWQQPEDNHNAERHADHLADAIAAHLAEVVGGLREEVARADWLRQQELACGRPIEGITEDFAWRMTPRRVREAYCFVADAVLAVVTEALTGHPARSGGAEGADGGRVALGEGGEVCGAQSGAEPHQWVEWPRTLRSTEVVMQCARCGVRSRRQVEGEVRG